MIDTWVTCCGHCVSSPRFKCKQLRRTIIPEQEDLVSGVMFLYQLLYGAQQSYLWHMNFFPSTSRVTSHSCWASRSCFSPENTTERGRRGTGEGWEDATTQRAKVSLSGLVAALSHRVWCSLPAAWCCHRGSPPPPSRCPTGVLLLLRPHPATAGDARWLCPPAQHSSAYTKQ